MPDINLTFSFASDAEDFTDQSDTGSITFSHEAGDGNAAGCVKFERSGVVSAVSERAATAAATWVSRGIPAAANVTHVKLAGYDYKKNDPGASAIRVRVRLTDSLGIPICSDLIDHNLGSGTSGWTAGAAGTYLPIDSDMQAAGTQVCFEVQITYSGSGAVSPSEQLFDNLQFAITYEEATVATPIQNLDGMVFMKGFAYASRGTGFSDSITMAALQECSVSHSYAFAEARGPESLQPLGVGITDEVLSGSIRHMVLNAEQFEVFIGGTSSYSGGTGKTTFTKLIDQEPNKFNLRLRTPEDGTDMEVLIYGCLATNHNVVDGSANREWKVFGVDWRAYGQSMTGGKKLFEVLLPGNQTGSS